MREVTKRLGLVVLLVCVCATFTAVNASEPDGSPEGPNGDPDGDATLCYFAGKAYSQGACLNGQRCQADGSWVYDWTCPQ